MMESNQHLKRHWTDKLNLPQAKLYTPSLLPKGGIEFHKNFNYVLCYEWIEATQQAKGISSVVQTWLHIRVTWELLKIPVTSHIPYQLIPLGVTGQQCLQNSPGNCSVQPDLEITVLISWSPFWSNVPSNAICFLYSVCLEVLIVCLGPEALPDCELLKAALCPMHC